jgi:hypothetical protein
MILRDILCVFFICHGLVHFFGFTQAFSPPGPSSTEPNISKPKGVLWLITALLFIVSSVLLYLASEWWWIVAVIAAVFSEGMILTSWKDAKFGTVVNIIVLLVAILGYGKWSFEDTYRREARSLLKQDIHQADLLTEKDITGLPEPVKKYIRYTGCIGKPKVRNFKATFTGQLRQDVQSEWMNLNGEQYNFIDTPARLFFLNATMKYLPVAGFHRYVHGKASMDIRLLSLYRVQYASGNIMDTTETVTYFNDLCCLAPAALIDKRISWQSIDSNTVHAVFSNNAIRISAVLYFNAKAELVNFVSDNRYATVGKTLKKYRWWTPLKNYKDYNGYRHAGYAETIYAYPKADFCYGIFKLQSIEYNCKDPE